MRVGCEGGSASSLQDNEEALGVLMDAIKKLGHEGKVKIGVYATASEFYKDGKHGLDVAQVMLSGGWVPRSSV